MSQPKTMDAPKENAAGIDGRTAVVPLIAYPSEHVRTPVYFNQYSTDHDINAVMDPWKVSPASLATVMDALRRTENVFGLVVTIPHKQEVAAFCDELEGVAQRTGVCNAIQKTSDGRLIGRMYDGLGFVQGLLDRGIGLQGKSVLVAGAGGAATAVAFELASNGVRSIGIHNRSIAKAEQLVAQMSKSFPQVAFAINPAAWGDYDIAVNATSLGLKPGDALPFDPRLLRLDALVAEVVMQPDITPLLHSASERGQPIHKGVHMEKAQIKLLVEFTTGRTTSTNQA
jgi:shikimate dehydrogenase